MAIWYILWSFGIFLPRFGNKYQEQSGTPVPNPWASPRRDQLIRVNAAVNKKEQLEKGSSSEEEEKKTAPNLY
jgi:hypothetical protein